MPKMLRNIALPLLLCLLWACGGDRAMQSALDRAEALMETRPDSALALLRPYDSIPAGSGEQRARFALLYSIALHKNFIDEESDSLINIAYEYYGSNGAQHEAMLSAYYKGYIKMNGRRFDKAAVLALESLEKAEQLKDTLFMARSCSLLGLIEYENYLMEEALPHYLRAATLYKAAGKTKNELVTLENAALTLDWLGHREESIQLLDSLKHQARAIGDTALVASIGARLVPILLKNGNPEPEITDKEVAALESYNYVYSDNPNTFSALALHRLYKGDLPGCDSLLRRARAAVSKESEKSSILSVEVERAKRTGDYKYAAGLTDSILKLQSAVVRELFKREITTAERDYMAAQSKRAEAEKGKTRTALWIAIGGFLIFGVVAAIAVRIIIRKRDEEIESKIDEIRLLSDTLKRNEASDSEFVGSLLQTHYKALDGICDQYFQGSESDVDRKLLKERLDSAMAELRSEESMAAIREFANRKFDSFLDKVKKEIPDISETDLNFIALIKAGFSSRTISLLQGMKRPTFYSKKTRWEKKLAEIGLTI